MIAARSPLARIDLRELSHRAPALAGDLAYKLFCTPALSSRRSADHAVLTARARFHLRNAEWRRVATRHGSMQAYILTPNGKPRRESILVAHGWTSESSFMMVMAEQFRRAGFRVVLFDQPGHGLSPGTQASLIDCSRALADVARALGPIQYVVAHSMGGLAALLVGEGGAPLHQAYDFERYVLIACPNDFSTVTREFAIEHGLSPAAHRAYERRLERIAQRSIASFNGAAMLMATGRPALILHAHDDEDVAFTCAGEIAARCPLAELESFDSAGHRRILYASQPIKSAVGFLTR